MTEHTASERVTPYQQQTSRFPLDIWVRANAVGLGAAFASFALVGGSIEAMGADHDSLARNLPAIVAMIAGGTAFALLRRRALGTRGPRWQAPAIGAGLTAGFVAGAVAVPLDFVAGILVAGTLGGALQLRSLRRQLAVSSPLVLVGTGSWLVAAVAAIAAAIFVGDVIITGMLGFGDALDGVAGFAAMFAVIGTVGGAVGGAIEGAVLRRRLGRAS